MSADRSQQFTRKALATAVASALVPASAYAAVGKVDFAYGDVVGVSSAGEQRRLTRGAEINEGDTILTNRGRAQLRFTDGARTSLLPNSEFRVDSYAYEEKAEEESSGFFSLLKGGLRTITGAIGRLRKEAYQVTTPSATIGIRGTEYLVVLGNSASLWVADGEIEACNEGGCTNFEGGESGFIAGANSKPIKTDQKPDTSGGDVDTTDYSAAEDVGEDGTPDVITSAFADGAFYALAISVGDSGEGGVAVFGESSVLIDAVFDANGDLVSYSFPGFDVAISRGTASVFESGNDRILGWGRWAQGTITLDASAFESSGAVTLSGSESHHYVVGLPTATLPTSGTGSYSLLGGTKPTYADGSGTGTLNSASLNVDFGTALVEASVNFSIGGNSFSIGSPPIEIDTGASTFYADGNFTSSVACSGPCYTEIGGFFAGAGASRAGVTYMVEEDFPFNVINGAAALTHTGTGSPISLIEAN